MVKTKNFKKNLGKGLLAGALELIIIIIMLIKLMFNSIHAG